MNASVATLSIGGIFAPYRMRKAIETLRDPVHASKNTEARYDQTLIVPEKLDRMVRTCGDAVAIPMDMAAIYHYIGVGLTLTGLSVKAAIPI